MLRELIESGAILKSPICIQRQDTLLSLLAPIFPRNAAFLSAPDTVSWDKQYHPYVVLDNYEFKLGGITRDPCVVVRPICVACNNPGGDPQSQYESHFMTFTLDPISSIVSLLSYYPQPWICAFCQSKTEQEDAA